MTRVEGAGSTPPFEKEVQPLEEIMSRLVSISDVDGAAILRGDGSVVSMRMKSSDKPAQYIDFMREYMSAAYQKNINYYNHGMFTEPILDYNGHKLLMSRINSHLLVILILKKTAYLGLTMLDVEGCLREIDDNLDEDYFGIWKIPG